MINIEKAQQTIGKKREIIFVASFGSTNYGTRDETSDNDYMVFLMPTMEDLYNGKMFSMDKKIDGDDYKFYDIRKYGNLLSKSNPTYLETLVAKETYVNPKYNNFHGWLRNQRFKIGKMNFKGLYNSMTGMAKEKMKAIEKDLPNEPTNEGYKRRIKFGFDTKQLLHVERLMAMRDEVFLWGKNFMNCVDLDNQIISWHSNLIDLKEKLLSIKRNDENLTKELALKRCKALITDMREYEDGPKINDMLLNENMDKILKEKIKQLVLNNIKGD